MRGLDHWIQNGPRLLDPPDDERCNACGELACEVYDGCTQPDCEGKLCPCPGVPDERWAEALDGAVDDAKIAELSVPPEKRS